MAVESVDCVPPPPRTLTLICAGCKGPRLTWLAEKCTELGASELVLAEFERSVVRVSDSHAQKLRSTAIEACKQCGRDWLPTIRSGVTADQALRCEPFDHVAIAHAPAASPTILEWFGSVASAGRLAVVIGPEGGLSGDEVERFAEMGGRIVRLADHVLRVETAAVAVVAAWAVGIAAVSRGGF